MAGSRAVAALVLALAGTAWAQQTLVSGTDATLDQCQVILGSMALGDGTFDRDTEFSASITDGSWSVPLSSLLNSTGDVLYVVPASKGMTYEPLTSDNRRSAGYCYDTTTLLPQYNPLAVAIPNNGNDSVTDLVVSPLSTVLVFGTAYGLTEFTMDLAFGLDPSVDVATYNYINEYIANPTGPAGEYFKESIKVDNIVTVGTTLLANTTDSYASFAVLIYQAFGRKALNASSIVWNAHLLNTSEAALDLNEVSNVDSIIQDAANHVYATKDWLLPGQLNHLSPIQYLAAATAATNLNQLTDSASDGTTLAKIAYYSEDQLAPMVSELADGSMDPEAFMLATTSDQLSSGVSSVQLPTGAGAPGTSTTFGSTNTESSSSSSGSSGLSGGAIAGIVIGVIAGVALIALVAAFALKRTSSTDAATTSGPRAFWRREHGEAV